ncbi:hypothetical protein [Paenibacillus ginsengarvi]|uniref:Uncharacterized protein n=1 Tax=Paenibacillus ginsengarvi TaxID=400777 RepID=A0A3B0BR66_9BACL|nr:hypothetical protein [Paenibacillus ginsengarvi]RKN75795.1 hypothetical protein D7M11_25145 [Paenibacillus ginsengarvi]
MSEYWTYVKVEWKLTLRSPSVIFLLVGLFLSVLVAFIDNPYGADIGRFTSEAAYRYMWGLSLLAQFWAVSAARRETASKVYLLQAALPYSSGALVGAKLTVLLVLFGSLALVPAVFYTGASWISGLALQASAPGIAMLASMTVPTAFTVLLGYWMGAWNHRRLVYVYSFGAVLLLLLFAKAALQGVFPLSWTHLLDYGLFDFIKTGFYSGLWGFTGDATYWLHRLAYASLVVLFFAAIVYREQRRRKERRRIAIYFPLFAGAALTIVLSLIANTAVWNERSAAYASSIDFYRGLVRENAPGIQEEAVRRYMAGEAANPVWKPLADEHKRMLELNRRYSSLKPVSYDMKVTTAEKHQMDVSTTLRLSHEGREQLDRFPLMLRHSFRITDMTVNGVKAAFDWEPGHDVVWVVPERPVLPGTKADVAMRYSGAVNEWRWFDSSGAKGIDDILNMHWMRPAFVDDHNLLLPGEYGWYPYPGTVRVAELKQIHTEGAPMKVRSETVLPAEPLRLPAEFRVEVETSAAANLIASGSRSTVQSAGGRQRVMFEAQGARVFSLFGGDIAEWTAAGAGKELTMITSGQTSPETGKRLAGLMLRHYTELSALAKRLSPDVTFPDRVRFIRLDELERDDEGVTAGSQSLTGVSLNERPREPIDKNGLVYLPAEITPASMTRDRLARFDEYLLAKTVLPEGPLSDSIAALFRYMTAAVTKWIETDGHPSEGRLFAPDAYRYNGRPHPVYMKMNDVLAQADTEQFRKTMVAIYEFARDYKGNEERTDADFIAFLNGLPGTR